MKKGTHLVVSGLLFTLVLLIWPVLMAIGQPVAGEPEQLQWLSANTGLFKFQFLFAFLICPAMLYMLYAQLNTIGDPSPMAVRLGGIFLAAYAVFSSIAYGSQMILIPQLIQAGMETQARLWYLEASPSIVYFLNQTGYFFWALAMLILFVPVLKLPGIPRALAVIYTVSAALSIVAYAGLIIENEQLNSVTFISGLMLLPTGVLGAFYGIRSSRSTPRGVA